MCCFHTSSRLIIIFIYITVLKKLHYMAVVKGVCTESMVAAQDEVKNNPGYIVNGEVAIFCRTFY